MKTEILSANSSGATSQAVEVLLSGGLVAFPTDTVYGVGALASDERAVESIYIAKDRPAEKALPVMIGAGDQLMRVVASVPLLAARLAVRFWPGPLTLIMAKHPNLPEAISATNTIAVRMPDHPIALTLLRSAEPMAVTSANLSGYPSPTTAQEVFEQLSGRIDLIIDGGKTPGGIPSTLVDCMGDKPFILREGPISMEQLLSAL